MRQTNVRGTLSLRGFRKLRTGAIVATGVILLGLGFLAPTVSANEQDGVWVARTVAEVKADIQNIDNLSHYTIKWGDTLSAISGATGLSVDSLVEINRIANRDLIFANSKLYFSEEVFLKDENTEVKRQQVSIDNSGSCQSYEVETKTDTVTGEQTTTVKQTTPVVVETPAVSAAKSETPVTVAPRVETRSETLNAPSTESNPVTDKVSSNIGTTNQPVVSNPSSEAPAPSVPDLKAETPAVSAPKADEPVASAPKVENPVASAPRADEPVSPAPKAEDSTASVPKNNESSSSVESSSTDNHSEESGTPSETPTGGSTATQPSDTSTELVTPGEATTPAKPAGEADKSEVSNPSPNVTNEGDSGASTPVTDNAPSNTGTTNQPVSSNPSSEATAPKVEEPTTSAPKNDESGSSVESPSTDNHSEESGTPSETPTGGSTATQPSDTSTELVTPGEATTPAKPAGEADKSEVSNPSPNVTNEGDSGASTPVTDNAPSNTGTTNQPVSSNPSSEATAPKAEEPTASAPKAEEPAVPAPKVEDTVASKEDTSAPNADKLTTNQNGDASNPVDSKDESSTPTPETSTSEPESAEPTTSAPKNDESGSSVESPSTDNHSEESGTPSETPTGGSTATQPSDTSTELVTPGEATTPAKPAGEADKSEVSNPSPNVTNEGDSGASTPVTDNAPSNTGTTNQPVSSNPSSEAATPKEDSPSEEVAPKDEKLEEAKKDGKNIIEEIATSKLSEIEKVKDEAEKAKLEAKLKELKEAGLEAINNAKDHDAAVDATAEYQSKIDEIDVPGEELPAPNYNKDNLTNGRNEGTTIDNGSTVIGHGSGEATATSSTQPVTEERSTSTVSPEGSSTQPASTETTAGTSSFRNAPSVQVRARRVARSTSEPDGTVNISYNFAGMPDIHGFLSDPGENNTVTIPAGTNEEQAKELVKEKIQAKIKDLATRGYHVKNDIIFEQDTTVKNYNYVVTFTKEATGTSGFRMAPAVQPRASRNRRSLEQPVPQKVKVNVFYNFDQMKDIAGFLGDINGTPLEVAEGSTNEQVKAVVKSQVEAKKEELRKRGYTLKEDYLYKANGKDYNYVVTFSKATK